ncbi:MAG TPA: glycosyltransferase family 4 protein [Spirochaetota bacterium]|nr:glycosyltransferase family 4 protein [Spirochaetota bacterium]
MTNKKLKILMLNYEFPPLGGGAANATKYILKELSKNDNISVDFVTSSTNTYREESFSNKIKIYFLDIGKKDNIHYQSNKDLLTYSFKALSFCKNLKKNNKYDLVHAFFGIPCGYIAMKLGMPYIVSLRGSDVPFYNKRFKLLDVLLFKKLSIKIWKKSNAVITNSEGLKNLALQTAPDQIISVIYNGVDIEEFKPRVIESNIFTVISTSRLIKRKGIQYLIDGFIEFAKGKNDVKLIVIGDGNQKEELISLVSENGEKDKIEFLGKINHDNLPKHYQSSDVFCLPFLNEGMSNALLEAMASGLAILATDTGGTKELIDESNGIIIQKESKKAITDSLNLLYNNRDLLTKMGYNSRLKAETMSWKKCAEKYIETYGGVKN